MVGEFEFSAVGENGSAAVVVGECWSDRKSKRYRDGRMGLIGVCKDEYL